MSQDKPSKAFDKAARRYFGLKAQGLDNTEEAIDARLEMLRHAPPRVHQLMAEAAKRNGLIPASAIFPEDGKQLSEWCDSADEIKARMQRSKSYESAQELYLLLQDANRLLGVVTEPFAQICPVLAASYEAANAEGLRALKVIFGKGKPK